jgi:hypothetical protein
MLKKTGEIFSDDLNPILCEVKRGFVEPCKNVQSSALITLSRVEISRLFTRVLFAQTFFQEQFKHTRSSTKISMARML